MTPRKTLKCKDCGLTSDEEPSVKARSASGSYRSAVLCNDCLVRTSCPMGMKCLVGRPTCTVCVEREALIARSPGGVYPLRCKEPCDPHRGDSYLVAVEQWGLVEQHVYCEAARDGARFHGYKVDAAEPVVPSVKPGRQVDVDDALELLAAEFMVTCPKVYSTDSHGEPTCGLAFNIPALVALLKKARDVE